MCETAAVGDRSQRISWNSSLTEECVSIPKPSGLLGRMSISPGKRLLSEAIQRPISRGYVRALLGMSSNGAAFTITRDFREKFALVYDATYDAIGQKQPSKHLSAAHRAGSTDTLSHFLLSLIGLDGKQLRRNQYGEKASLTIRHVAHLTVVSEERIISKLSPAFSGELVLAPLERSVFSFFLTGVDDADLTPQEKPKERKARLDTVEVLIRSILENKQALLAKIMGTDVDAAGRLNKVDAAISEATQLLSVTQEEIARAQKSRKEHWEEIQKRKSRKLFVSEQLKRLSLLREFYHTDRIRLESVIEAGNSFEVLPGGECAVCGNKPGSSPAAATVAEFKASCARELTKLGQLSADLERAISEMSEEEVTLERDISSLDIELATDEQHLERILKPQSVRVDQGLSELIRVKTDVSKAVDLRAEVEQLEQRLRDIEAARKQKPAKLASDLANVGTARAARFCEVVQETLRRWKCAVPGNVAFDADPKRFDIVLGDQDRGSMGKGYRAITHAAFIIGLMRYCRREKIPHPGFVVLDTPLNPFKGPDDGPGGLVNDEVKNAFYEDLANDTTGDQFIILENTEPPGHVIPKIRYHHFTKNADSGRYGFFALPDSQPGQFKAS